MVRGVAARSELDDGVSVEPIGGILRFVERERLELVQGQRQRVQARLSENDIRRLEATGAAAKQEVLQQLKQEVQPLVDGKQYGAAAALYRNYRGSQAAETAKAREDLASALAALAEQEQAQDQQKSVESAAAMKALRDRLLAGLCGNNLSLVALLAKQLPEETAGAAVPDLAPLRALADAAVRSDALIAKTFEADIEKTIKVRLTEGETEMTIRGVEGKVIAADKVIRSTTGGGGMLAVKISPQALALKEKLARLQRQDLPQGDLLCGLVALWGGDRAAAINLFENDGSELGKLLAAAAKKAP